MNYYQHNIGDYRRDTSHLSLLEHGIYRQLLDWYYLDEKEIPKETQVVMRRLSARTQDEQNAVQIILKEFFVEGEAGWKHKRCDVEIAHYQEKADKNRSNGKLGGRPKKTQVDMCGFQDEKPNESEHNLNHKPITNNQSLTTLSGKPDAVKILEHLNQKAGRKFKPVKATITAITARLKEHSFDELIAVIDDKCAKWRTDEKMAEYLRPDTLFNATKCASYVGALGITPAGKPWYIGGANAIKEMGEKAGLPCPSESGRFPAYKSAVFKKYNITEDMVRQASQDFQ